MGLALNEVDREARAMEFYDVLSTFDFMSSHAHAVQLGHASVAAVVVLPDDRLRRPRRDLRGDQGERASVQVRRRPWQRLDERPRDGLAHQGDERQVAGRRAVPQGGQRHGGRGESVLRSGHAGLHRSRRAAHSPGSGRRSRAGPKRRLSRSDRQARLRAERSDGRDRRQAFADADRGHRRPSVLGACAACRSSSPASARTTGSPRARSHRSGRMPAS